MYPCPSNFFSRTGTACPSGARSTEGNEACLLPDTPKTSQYLKTAAMSINASPSTHSYFYIYPGQNIAGRKVVFTIDNASTPVTIYMSTKTGNPTPNNYEMMAKNVAPSFSITSATPENQPLVYFSILAPGSVTIQYHLE